MGRPAFCPTIFTKMLIYSDRNNINPETLNKNDKNHEKKKIT